MSYYSAPCSQATSPVQPFAMGSSPKEATVSESLLVGVFSQGQWSNDPKEDSEVSVDPAFPPGCSSSSSLRPAVIWGSRRCWGLCPADLSSPRCGPHWPGPGLREAVTLSPPLPRPGSTVHLGCHLQDLLPHPLPHGRPEETEGQLGWMSGSLSDDG